MSLTKVSYSMVVGATANVLDYGASPSAAASTNTAAFIAALAVSDIVYVPSGNYALNGAITVISGKRLYGNGASSILTFTFTGGDSAIKLTGTSGRQQIVGLSIIATALCTKVISVGSPMVFLNGLTIVQQTATGHGIYLEDEVTNVTYSFGCQISECRITGIKTTGNYGIRTALYSQATLIQNNLLETWGTHIYVNGAITQLSITDNILEATSETGSAINVNSGGAAYAISILRNYFEENQTCVKVTAGTLNGLTIAENYAVRNTAYGAATAYFYHNLAGAISAASSNTIVDQNYVLDFGTFLGLEDQYGSNFISVRGNTLDTVIDYSTGTYARNAYDIQTINNYYTRRLVSGAFISEDNTRLQAKLAVFEVPVLWTLREYIEKITFRYVQVAGTGVTVEFRKIFTANGTDTLISTATVNTDVVTTLAVNGIAIDGYNYYLKITYDNTGTAGYVYPFEIYFRQ